MQLLETFSGEWHFLHDSILGMFWVADLSSIASRAKLVLNFVKFSIDSLTFAASIEILVWQSVHLS